MQQFHHLSDLSGWSRQLTTTASMPVIFVGHGTPMNAIENNEFTQCWQRLGEGLPQPTAILCISAHWLTRGKTALTAMPKPNTIHDFSGFPRALFEVQYPATGNQALINETIAALPGLQISQDHQWGLDHGTWSVLRHMYPNADVPVVQLSIDYSQPAAYHYQLAKSLQGLRERGVLLIASGSLVHNLRHIVRMDDDLYFGYDWAKQADAKMQQFLLNHDHQALIDWDKQGVEFKLSIPTPDHYYPMLYALALQREQDQLSLFNATTTMGSLSMTSFVLQAS